MQATLAQIKEIRQKTGLGLNEIIEAFKKAKTFDDIYGVLKERGIEIAEIRRKRDAKISRLNSYVHPNGKYGSLVEFRCETDFVAKSEVFAEFMHNICMHVAATPLPHGVNSFLGWDEAFTRQPYVKDYAKTVADVVAEIAARTGEKIEIGTLYRNTTD